jgi:ADP-ribose pyrophosphatase YjhB (NUDIX family)
MGEVVSAGGIILSDPNARLLEPSLLVLRRPKGYALPKGRVERNETVAHAARREVLEETGILAEIIGLAGMVNYEANDYDDFTNVLLGRVDNTVILFYMRALRREGDPEPGSEPLWVPQSEAIADMHHPEVGEFLGRVLSLENVAAYENAVANGQQYNGGGQQYYGIPALKAAA